MQGRLSMLHANHEDLRPMSLAEFKATIAMPAVAAIGNFVIMTWRARSFQTTFFLV
jgi:hypothetical protein